MVDDDRDDLAELMGCDPASLPDEGDQHWSVEYEKERVERFERELEELAAEIDSRAPEPDPHRIESRRYEPKSPEPRAPRSAPGQGYWINKDGTVDGATAQPEREEYRPEWDDVDGDATGGIGAPGPRE